MIHSKHLLLGISLGLSLLIMLFSSCENTGIENFNPPITAKNEKDLGNKLVKVMQENPATFPILKRTDYPQAYQYLDEIMRMVEVKTDIRSKLDWEIIILSDSAMHVFTLPGGKIIITTGFLKFLHSENQLFSVIAHEAYYANRIDQSRKEDHSPVMKLLTKGGESPYLNTGTKIFLDVIRDGGSQAVTMVNNIRNLQYEPWEVLVADKFSLDVICGNYLYSAYGIKEIILNVEQNNAINQFEWFEKKPPLPNNLMGQGTASSGPFRDQRVEQINEFADLERCGAENTTQNIANYTRLLSSLGY